MLRTILLGVFGMGVGVGIVSLAQQPAETAPTGPIDAQSAVVARIPVGTVIGEQPPPGWSHIVLFATPTLTEAALREAPKMANVAIGYARMFKFTILANVATTTNGGKTHYYLDKVGRGFATNINGQETIVSGKETRGASMGMFGKLILDENEKCIDSDLKQVVRTSNMMIIDGIAVMLRDGQHVKMVMRHAIVVDPNNGNLQCFIWLLTRDYQIAEQAIQALPNNCHEERLLSILREKFNALGIPTRDAFALRRVPPGKAVGYNDELRWAATVSAFTPENVPHVERILLHTARWLASGKG